MLNGLSHAIHSILRYSYYMHVHACSFKTGNQWLYCVCREMAVKSENLSSSARPARPGALPAPAVPAYPKGYTDKHLGGTTSATFPNGLPERDLDHGTSRNDQPRANQAQAGAQPTRSILRSRKRP